MIIGRNNSNNQPWPPNNNQPWPPNNNNGNQPAPPNNNGNQPAPGPNPNPGPAPSPNPGPAPAPGPTEDDTFSFNAQDQTVMPASTTLVSGVNTAGGSVQTNLVKLEGPLAPSEPGKYVFDQADSKWTTANTFASVANTAATFQTYLDHPVQWATGNAQLTVTPDAGEDFNAYYSRQDGGVFFFHGTDPVTNQVIFSGNSGEVTGHETGHALLDSVRPGYFSSWSPDPGAFHESFGDVLALLSCLRQDGVVAKVVEQTGGDLSKQNCAAALGEELGVAINHVVGHDVTGGDFTRNAINSFKWQDPNTMPNNAGPDQLTAEVHSYSRLWTGAIYDILTGITNANLAAGQAPADAIKNAADEGLKMQARLFKTAPEGDFTFKDMANALIQSEDQFDGGKYTDLIRNVMTARNILQPSTSLDGQAESVPQGSHELKITLDGPQFGKFNGASVSTLLSGDNKGIFQDAEDKLALQNNMSRLIKNGAIKWTEPNQVVTKKDLFNEKREPYMGVVRWVDGQPTIERVTIAG